MPSSENYYKTLDAGDITAGTVTVTPAVQPLHGCAHVSRMEAGKAKPKVLKLSECPLSVSGTDLVIDLSGLDAAGDVVHWTSYGA